MFERIGALKGHSDIAIMKINDKYFALEGWNGEQYTKAWECTELGHEKDDRFYEIIPVYKQIDEDEFEIVDYEVR